MPPHVHTDDSLNHRSVPEIIDDCADVPGGGVVTSIVQFGRGGWVVVVVLVVLLDCW